MAFKSEDDRKIVRDMIIAGQGMPEIMALEICNQADVYGMRHILKQEGVVVKKSSRSTSEETPSSPRQKVGSTKGDCPAWLEGLLREQESLQERLRRIDSLVALYDDLIPLPKGLRH